MADLNAIPGLDEEIPADDIQDLPEPTGGYTFLQPGNHVFKLPSAEKGLSTVEAAWEAGLFRSPIASGGDLAGKNYLQFRLKGGKDKDGEPAGYPLRVKSGGLYGTILNNLPDFRADKNGKKFNTLLRLLKALGHEDNPKTIRQYMAALVQYADASFGAEIKLGTKATQALHGFDARYESWVYFQNKRDGKPLETPYTAQNGNQTLPLLPDEDGVFHPEMEIAHPGTGEMKTLRVFGNLERFFSVKNGHA